MTFYVGVDIAKYEHVASILDSILMLEKLKKQIDEVNQARVINPINSLIYTNEKDLTLICKVLIFNTLIH